MKLSYRIISAVIGLAVAALSAQAASHSISSLEELMELASQDGNEITMAPGTYKVRDYLTPERIAAVGKNLDYSFDKRPPNPVLTFSGSDNTYHLDGVTIEIDTGLFDEISLIAYHRFFFINGHRNKINGLTIRYNGPQQGCNGTALTVWGDHNTLEDVSLFVHGSQPYGYGDLLGKGHSRITRLEKHSGLMVGGDHTTLRRCRVISRAFGHCFYVQGAHNTLIEDCYAEGINRSTSDMLRDSEGPAAEVDFKSVYENRSGQFKITPGYRKSLTEDGFRTYGSGGPRKQKTGKTTLINCTAINTRAGFEIIGPEDGAEKTTLTNCTSLGAERAFLLINGNIVTRKCRGDIKHGPLLYLWRGANADVELEVAGQGSDYTVHSLATISGENHRVKLTRWEPEGPLPELPIMLGYGMPAHAEMSSPILPEEAKNITLINETQSPIVSSNLAQPPHPDSVDFSDPVK
ncbi:right-handed parallel beta-helix repeat-containing protein [Pelagicoccus sp. SDUM812005]|uniref:right-handed parallel beta-helix repeat-containing protein n=1 Tax=Pelagicoccus sp. SDUM812005 TaxID=3041257 RepID=UPI00280D090F|nr:right-handed parallel beta-helix repeat-containing protein [Pelagicoccus sp. SDUM812005]MDQ8181566.1 right-handed parallel beta-helix repeat-containing protein [Pelagicoccus sp. SDUM812005]